MPGLISKNLTTGSNLHYRNNPITRQETFQLCACADGKLFMAEATSLCLADYHICSS
jgi:hypothetical protein